MPPSSSTQRVATPIAATLAAAFTIAAQVGGKATRDALFLSSYPASELPKVMLGSAVLAVLAVLAVSRGLARVGPARLVPWLFLLSGGAFAAEWLLVQRAPALVATVVYLHVAVVGVTLISGFWSVVNERFDPHTAKHVVARIAAGATVGGLLGGLIAERVAAHLHARAMLLVLAGLNALCAVSVWRTGAPRTERHAPSQSGQPAAQSGLAHLRTHRYLQLIGLLVALTAMAAGFIDYVFKAEAASTFTTSESLMSFFAIFYTATSLVAVVLQTGLGGRALSRLGLGGTIAILPAAVLVAGVLGAAVTRLWSMVVLRGAQAVLNNSLFRGAYELLFTPVAPEAKRPTKTLLDVGGDRLGGAVASGIMMALLALVPQSANIVAILLTIATAGVTLVVSLRLHRGYIAELATSLRTGAIELAESDVIDATTRRTLSETTMAIDRENLLAQIQKLRSEQQQAQTGGAKRVREEDVDVASTMKSPERPEPLRRVAAGDAALADDDATGAPPVWPTEAEERLMQRIAALRSGDREQIRRALKGRIERELVSHVIPLLDRDEVARAARRALRAVIERSAGQLTDALLDTALPLKARRRIAALLSSSNDSRAAAGLLRALLEAEDAELRRRAVRSLGELVERNAELAPPERTVLEAVRRELDREEEADLDHVFGLLCLAFDAATLKLALRALRSDDESLQGTSLEYLENVLPEPIAEALWPSLEAVCRESLLPSGPPSRRAGGPKRQRHEIAAELRRSADQLVIDRDELLEPPAS